MHNTLPVADGNVDDGVLHPSLAMPPLYVLRTTAYPLQLHARVAPVLPQPATEPIPEPDGERQQRDEHQKRHERAQVHQRFLHTMSTPASSMTPLMGKTPLNGSRR